MTEKVRFIDHEYWVGITIDPLVEVIGRGPTEQLAREQAHQLIKQWQETHPKLSEE